jgi:hypothetical protein
LSPVKLKWKRQSGSVQAQKLNQEYQAGLKKDPHSFETAYKAIGVLGINSEIFNEKIEILEQFLKEMDKLPLWSLERLF